MTAAHSVCSIRNWLGMRTSSTRHAKAKHTPSTMNPVWNYLLMFAVLGAILLLALLPLSLFLSLWQLLLLQLLLVLELLLQIWYAFLLLLLLLLSIWCILQSSYFHFHFDFHLPNCRILIAIIVTVSTETRFLHLFPGFNFRDRITWWWRRVLLCDLYTQYCIYLNYIADLPSFSLYLSIAPPPLLLQQARI